MSKSIQMLTFDESYCHSSGVYDAKIYEIKKDTKEVKFNFIDINKFWLQYFVNNQYLPEAVKKAVLEHEELFTVQLVQESCAYIYTEDMKDEIILNAKTLQLSQGKKKFHSFTHGILSIGVFNGTPNFAILWASMYKNAS